MFFVTINADIKRTAIEGKYFLSLAALHSVLLARRGFHFAFSIVYCWFSPLREVFLRVLWFSPLLKNQTFKFQFDLERTDTFQRVLMNSLVLRG